MIDRLDEDRLFKWAINARTALSGWSQGGRITLLGDAAHAMTPFMGQGASSAIEDAVVLARAVEASDDLPEVLARYEDADSFDKKEVRNEETLGLFAYDAATVAV